MSNFDERLSTLLHSVPDPPIDVTFDDVADGLRRRRRLTAGSVVVAVGLAVAAVLVLASLVSPPVGRDNLRPVVSPKPAPSGGTVSYRGLTFELPTGWTVARQPQCGVPPDRSVTIGDHPTKAPSCPGGTGTTVQPTYVEMTDIFGRQYALGPPVGPTRRLVWHGQPAWRNRYTQRYVGSARTVTTYTLMFPWLNASVAATSENATEARALLNRVRASSPRAGWSPPTDATSIFMQSLAGHDGDHLQRSVMLTRPSDVRRILGDLAALHPTADPAAACDVGWYPNTVTVTVALGGGAVRTYAVRFDRCAEVMDGSGAAAVLSARLRADIVRYVPNSGFSP